MRERIQGVVDDARAWSSGRSWQVRAPVLLWGAWVLVQHLRSPTYTSLFGGLNLGIHELGHLILLPLGQTMHIVGGSLAQLLAPLAAAGGFLRQRDYFAVSFSFLWFGASAFELASYVGDARARELPLVSPFGGDPIHDWHFLLSKAGLLGWDGVLSFLLRSGGAASMAFFLLAGGWLLKQMRAARRGPSWPSVQGRT